MVSKALPLVIEVVKIQGYCPMHRVGDCFIIRKGYQLCADQPICMHALQALLPYYVPLSRGINPIELGLIGPQGAAHFECHDPQCYSGGSTVTFRVTNDENRLYHCKPFEGKMAVRW